MVTRHLPILSALSLLTGGLFLGLPAGQTQRASGSLPGRVLLRLRHKAGDVYLSRSVDTERTLLVITDDRGKNFRKPGVIVEDETKEMRIQAVQPEGLIVAETRTLRGTKRTTENGKTLTRPSDLEAWRSLYDSRNHRLKRTSLLPLAQRKPDDGLDSGDPGFPVEPVGVNDTWSGTLHLIPASISKRSEVDYQARLEAIERYQNIPCARIVYTFDATIPAGQLSLNLNLPKGAQITGQLKVGGTITEWTALDSGNSLQGKGALGFDAKIAIVVKDAVGNEQHADMDFAITIQGTQWTIQHPPYNPALVNTEPGKKAVSSGHKAR